jgi:hypothetical protein
MHCSVSRKKKLSAKTEADPISSRILRLALTY